MKPMNFSSIIMITSMLSVSHSEILQRYITFKDLFKIFNGKLSSDFKKMLEHKFLGAIFEKEIDSLFA